MCTKVSAYIYLCYVYVCVITGVCLHAHTHVHTHTPQFPSLQSFLHCTTTFQPAFWPLRPAAFALAGRLQGQKNEFLTLPTQELYHSFVIQGDLTSSFAYVLVFLFLVFCFFFFWQVNSSSLLGLYPSTCLPLSDFLGQKHVFAAGPHPSAICKIQDPSLITVWNWNQKVLEWIHAQ